MIDTLQTIVDHKETIFWMAGAVGVSLAGIIGGVTLLARRTWKD